MAYITREDGEHFVIPSYRDVLVAKNKNALKKEILLLSQNYGEYITLQRKNTSRYEVAFSPDTGYLLGESIWHQFKRPQDMIYCEAIPNTTEAILVIVKAGSVYLDGSFPLESIPEELIIFLTQENNFEIYLYGDVPISEMPEEGKFNFETSSVKSFTILDQPVFPTLPLLKAYQLQLVDTVLKAHGIGVFPIKLIGGIIIALGLIWMLWSYLTSEETIVPQIISSFNPYQPYYDSLMSPSPTEEVNFFTKKLQLLLTAPGWTLKQINYTRGMISASMQSDGASMQALFDWAKFNEATVNIKEDGIEVAMKISFLNRPLPTRIYAMKEVLGTFIDRIASVYPGNSLSIKESSNRGVFTITKVTINLEGISPTVLTLIGEQLKGLPLVLHTMSFDVSNGSLTGTIELEALGN